MNDTYDYLFELTCGQIKTNALQQSLNSVGLNEKEDTKKIVYAYEDRMIQFLKNAKNAIDS